MHFASYAIGYFKILNVIFQVDDSSMGKTSKHLKDDEITSETVINLCTQPVPLKIETTQHSRTSTDSYFEDRNIEDFNYSNDFDEKHEKVKIRYECNSY